MTKKLLFLILLKLMLLSSIIHAQAYQTLNINDFNHYIIDNETGSALSSTTNYVVQYTPNNNILYVKKGATGTGDGSSWENAIPELADALIWANNNKANFTSTPLQIWVAQGTYRPMYSPEDGANFGTNQNRDNSFLMVKNVELYGGFLGTETNLTQRNFNTNVTTLSGDIGVENDISDNTYHVVVSAGDVGSAKIDGFIITKGNADNFDAININAIVIYNPYGGGIYIQESSPTITNTTFSNNTALQGGGIYNYYESYPIITCTSILNNTADLGGGIYNNLNSSPTLTNTTISNNTADSEGGGVYNRSSSPPKIYNSIIWENRSSSNQSARNIYKDFNSSYVFKNSLIQGSIVNSNWNSSFGTDGGNNINANPMFANPTNGDFTLTASSPAINTGDNALYGASLATATDLAGNPRLFGTTIDMGAYEYHPVAISPTNNVLFVKQGATSTGDGSSWENAIPELADALIWANNNKANFTSTPLQIWVASGTYKPMYSPEDGANFGTNQNRDNSFLMVKNVELYGGFLGTETNLTQRNYNTNVTTLSGDIGVENDISDNTYQVVVSVGEVGSAKIDGFTITKGNANESESIIINEITFYRIYGGGIYNYSSSPTITNTIISNNTANLGGGIGNEVSLPILTNTIISNNTADLGGGIFNYSSSPTLTNTTIFKNTAISGGGIHNYNSSPTLTNTTISKNRADSGAGIHNSNSDSNSDSSPIINNSIIWGNTDPSGQSIENIFNEFSNPSYKNSLIQGSIVNSNWNSSFGTDGGNNIDADPIFSDPTNGDFTLTVASPAINTGDNALYGASLTTATDLAGNPRLFGTTIDMGAYEYQSVVISPTNNILFVKQGATGTGDGSSWANAIPELADALKWADNNKTNFTSTPLQIWVAEGTYKPMYSPEDGLNFGINQGRRNSFLMVKNVELYGGFFGNETNLTERNFKTNVTTLSGDIGVENDISDNTYHVVLSAGDVGSAKIDGFTITKGNANEETYIRVNESLIDASAGGGIINYNSSPALTNTIISGNSANHYGGGIYNEESSPTITNTIISGNSAIYSGGGIYNTQSSLTITNTTISNNTAGSGGGINNVYSNLNINNSIIWGNRNSTNQSIENIYNYSSDLSYKNSLIQGSIVNSNWDSSFGTDDGNNIDADPMFSDPTNGDFTLTAASPAINKGDNALYGTSLTTATDLAGNPRLFGTTIDMGAYEYHPVVISPSNNVLFVKQGATGTGDGSSWENAIPELADALIWANNNKANFTSTTLQVWVAKGTYKPMYSPEDGTNYGTNQNRNNSFLMVKNVELYGGFFGNETNLTQRNFNTNLTTLSGDIGIENDISDNTYQVVASVGEVGSAKIDGFTITKGNANNGYSPIIINEITFYRIDGGGIYNYSSSPTIANTIISGNSTSNYGGGIYILSSSPTLTNTTISNNTALQGGGIYNFLSSPTLTNTTISNNTALQGGGIYNYYFASTIINNSIIWENRDPSGQSIENIFNDSSNPTYKNSLIQGSIVNSNWNSSFGTDGGNNIDADPMFSEPTNGDFTLTNVSPAINTGGNALYGASLTTATDLAGNPRLFGTTIDMGAYEYQACPSISAPTAVDQAFCIAENATVANLNATGQNIKWYESANSATALNTNVALVNGAPYFASQTVNDCESVTRKEVVVTIHNTPAPTAVDQAFCIAENATVANLNATGDNIKWYETATSTTALNTNVALVNGSSYFATQTVNGCESIIRKEIVVTIHNTAAPTAVNQAFCFAENATIADLVATGQNIKWYESANSATALNTNVALVNGASYFASQTVNDCESVTRKEVVVTIHNTPAPTAVDQEFCIAENATVVNLNATGQNIKWYESANSATALNTNVALVNGASYFASQTVNGCESVIRKKVVVTIHNTPAPTAVDQAFCIAENATVANLNATGQNIKWYESANSATALNTNVALVNGASYFASQTVNGCESVIRKKVVVTIHNTAAPTAVNQAFCFAENATIADLVATGQNIKWYESANSATALNTNVTLVNGASYFASQTVSGCESVTRKKVVVTIHDTPAPTAVDQEFCIAENATVANLNATGDNIKWYESANSATALNTNVALVNGTYYFASQTVSGCESVNRKKVVVTIHDTPAPTAVDQEFCIAENATVANLNATGDNIKWYESANSATALNTNVALVNGTSYFASQTVSGCESVPRKEVVVTIHNTPAPTAVDQAFCIVENATVANLNATGDDIKWYESANSTNALNTNVALVNGTSYFASQTVNGCESANRTQVLVTIHNNLAPNIEAQTFCGEQTVANLPQGNGTYKWYESANSATALNSDVTLVNGASYFASQTVNDCESANRTQVLVTIHNTLAPNIEAQNFCGAQTVANLPQGNGTYKWYQSANSATALNTNVALVNGTSYFASQTVNDCESANRTQVLVTIHNTLAPNIEAQTFCGAQTVANLPQGNGTYKWYVSENSVEALSLTTSLVNGTSYFATQTVNGCESVTRKEVVVTIHNTLAPNIEAQTFCGTQTVANLPQGNGTYKWYQSANSATALNSDVALVNGASYFASQTVSGCESVTRKEVVVTIHNTAAPTAIDQEFCIAENATVANLNATGDNIKWYESANSATALNTNVALVNGTSYFASQTVSGCESVTRKEVVVTIHNTPAPSIEAQAFCGAQTVANLPQGNGTYKWYLSENAVEALSLTTSLETGIFFVSEIENGCESIRTSVQITIVDLPDTPTGEAIQTFIEGSTLNQIIINPTTVVYYITEEDAITNTNPLPSDMPLVNGTTYYAVNIGTNGCLSLPLPITIEVYLSNNEFEKDKLKYYPNPVNNKLNIEYFENIIQIDVYDLLGRNIKTIQMNDRNVEIDLSELSSSTYMIKLKTESKEQFIKIIKN